jgi:predicted nucleic acid-binding protein
MDQPLMIDSNYYIDHLRQGKNPFIELERIAQDWELATCGMIMLEVQRGLKTERLQNLFERGFATMLYVPTTNAIWSKASALAWQLDRGGRVVPAQDHVIAASALSVGAAVLTTDAHFHEFPGLTVYDPPE